MIQIASGVNKFSLLAIPFFVLAGAIMAEGGIANRLVNFAAVFVGFIRGGLSLVNILASTFFGAISGSSVADTASIGTVLIPQMEKKGYPRDFATAVTCSGSVQALLIPPSHNAVIYSLAAGGSVSIAALFVAGVMPGILLGATMMGMCLYFAKKRNFPKGDPIPLRDALRIMPRGPVGTDDGGDHPRRHPLRRLHRHRIGLHRLPLGLFRHHVHLPRL
jgi:tripartite ATP-independent transporter DctM subunit